MAVPSKQRAQEILDTANQAHPDLKFELETPDNEGFLPILDTKIRITDEGCLEHEYYIKKANKGLILPYSSHHPKRLLHNIAKNQLTQMDKLSDNRHCAADQRRMQQSFQIMSIPKTQLPNSNSRNRNGVGLTERHKNTKQHFVFHYSPKEPTF